MLRGGRITANITGVCGVLGPHWVCPAHGVCAFLAYTAQAPGCSAGDLSKVGPGLHALLRSKPLRFRFSGTPRGHRLGWACVLCPSPVRAAQVTRCLARALSPGAVRLIPSPVPAARFPVRQQERRLRRAACLLWGADLWLRPSWWMSTVQDPRKTWLATGSLLAVWKRMQSLGPSLPLPSGSGCCPPAFLPPVQDG